MSLEHPTTKEEFYQRKLETTPHAEIELPSKGILYPKDNILHKGVVKMSYMKGKHENILLSPALFKNGNIFDVLLTELILDEGFDAKTLTISDKMFLIISARCMALGFEYTLEKFICESCDNITEQEVFNLADIDDTVAQKDPDSHHTNEFTFKSSLNEDVLVFKSITVETERDMVEKFERYKKTAKKDDIQPFVSFGIASLLLKVNGTELTFGNKVDYVDNLPIRLFKEIQKFTNEIAGNTSPHINHTCSNCGHVNKVNVQVGLPFFFPK